MAGQMLQFIFPGSPMKQAEDTAMRAVADVLQEHPNIGNFVDVVDGKPHVTDENHRRFLLQAIKSEINANERGDPLRWFPKHEEDVVLRRITWRGNHAPKSPADYCYLAMQSAALDTMDQFSETRASEYEKGDFRKFFWGRFRYYFDTTKKRGVYYDAMVGKGMNKMINSVHATYSEWLLDVIPHLLSIEDKLYTHQQAQMQKFIHTDSKNVLAPRLANMRRFAKAIDEWGEVASVKLVPDDKRKYFLLTSEGVFETMEHVDGYEFNNIKSHAFRNGRMYVTHDTTIYGKKLYIDITECTTAFSVRANLMLIHVAAKKNGNSFYQTAFDICETIMSDSKAEKIEQGGKIRIGGW